MRRAAVLIMTSAITLLLTGDGRQLAASDRYGAIAAASDGRYGYSYDFGSRSAAENEALSNCGYSGCVVKVWFKNNCAAYARGDGGEGWAYADTRGQAERRALDECSNHGDGCRILCWACNGRP